MIKLPGELTIRIINGRNGPFRVGRLVTRIGEFAVKDPVFDQYDEGQYSGEFIIRKIYASSYTAANRLVVEIRAELESLVLETAEIQQQEQEPIEQDPIEEEVSKPKPEQSEPVESTAHSSNNESHEDEELDSDEVLFGVVWPLGVRVKLDPTVGRDLFRQQRDRLKALGYTFQAVGQVWIKTK